METELGGECLSFAYPNGSPADFGPREKRALRESGYQCGLSLNGSLNDRPKVAKKFYGVLAVSVTLGLALNLLRVNAVKMLFYAAVINGVLAPPLIVLVTMLTSDKKIMGERINPPWLKWLGWATASVMTAAIIAMIVV